MSDYIRQHAVKIDYKLGESWIILNEIEQSIKKKIETVGTPLRDWNISINYGIKTGLNEAFIISKEKRDELIKTDPKSAEIIRPILRGRDIKKNSYEFANIYVITAYKGINKIIKKEYPAIYLHLKKYEKKLRQRGQVEGKPGKPGSNQHHWTELDNNVSLEKLDDFSKPKIFWSDISTSSNFVLINDEIYINNTAYMITDIHPNAVYILNSRIMNWYFSKICSDLGNSSRYFKQYVELLPLPHNADIYNDLSSENTDSKLSAFYQFTSEEYKKIK
ncbi:TaqI-like C-terminal specificity domain-containing protein [Ligilactobacillus salivarius]|uniref:TaqI-like C-terminal specificity domain-containing protein n=1 Tax=Ligilactobacillus salivarius TaxID=1624 RepID=UPI000BB08F98|nr:TaqI-like C-terminal specificity domain-containing protein [Ligilactobacillus salivarius]